MTWWYVFLLLAAFRLLQVGRLQWTGARCVLEAVIFFIGLAMMCSGMLYLIGRGWLKRPRGLFDAARSVLEAVLFFIDQAMIWSRILERPGRILCCSRRSRGWNVYHRPGYDGIVYALYDWSRMTQATSWVVWCCSQCSRGCTIFHRPGYDLIEDSRATRKDVFLLLTAFSRLKCLSSTRLWWYRVCFIWLVEDDSKFVIRCFLTPINWCLDPNTAQSTYILHSQISSCCCIDETFLELIVL